MCQGFQNPISNEVHVEANGIQWKKERLKKKPKAYVIAGIKKLKVRDFVHYGETNILKWTKENGDRNMPISGHSFHNPISNDVISI